MRRLLHNLCEWVRDQWEFIRWLISGDDHEP